MTIGIFDSGKGAWLVRDRLEKLLPEYEYLVVTDAEHLPYGTRPEDEIRQLVGTAIQPLIASTKLIVIACNTATAAAIGWLRESYPDHTFVGYEPMIKTAAASSKHFCMLATRATRASDRYTNLKKKWAPDCIIDEPDTLRWAQMVEADQTSSIPLGEIALSVASGADEIILACTHYLALQETLEKQFPGVTVIEPTPAVARRIQSLIADLQLQ